LNAGKLSIEY